MSWFGGGLSKLQNFTRDVINDVVESVQGEDDSVVEREATDDKYSELQNQLSVLQEQNDVLQVQNRELESQLSTLSRQYRNLLSSSKANEGDGAGHNGSSGATGGSGSGQSATSLQVAETWREVQTWLREAQIVLPAHLDERCSQWTSDSPASDVADSVQSRECCRGLREQIVSLEQQLEELDRQNQAALEVAITTRTQYQKENRELQEQLLQLVKERDEAQQPKTGSLFPIDEESEDQVDDRGSKSPVETTGVATEDLKAENESFRLRIDQLTGQLQELAAQLASVQLLSRSETEELKVQYQQLQDDKTAMESDWKSQVDQLKQENERLTTLLQAADQEKQVRESREQEEKDRLTSENVDIRRQIQVLEAEHQQLAQKTMVLDQLSGENDRLKADVDELNRRNEDLLAKSEAVDQLEGENRRLQSDLTQMKRLAEENGQLRDRLEQLEVSNRALVENCEKASKLAEENADLQSRLTELLCRPIADHVEATSEHTNGAQDDDSKQMAELRAEMQRLAAQSKELKQLNEDNGSLRQQISALTAENEKLIARCGLLESHVEEVERCHSTEKSDLSAQLEQLKTSNGRLESEIESVRLSMEQSSLEHENRLKAVIQELEASRIEQTSSSSEHEALRIQAEDLTARCRNLGEELNEKNSLVVQIQTKLDEESTRFALESQELGAKIHELEQLQQAQQEAADESRNQEVVAARSEVARLQAEKQDLENELESLKADQLLLKDQHEQAAEEARKEAERLRSECQSLEERIQNASEGESSQIAQLEESKKALVGELEAANQEIEQLRHSASTSDDDRKEAEASMTQLQNRCQQLQEEGANLSAQCQKYAFDIQQLERDKEQLALALQAFQQQREQLVQTVQQKHQESVTYHTEAQRLAKICEDLQARLNEQSELNEEAAKWVSENDALKSVQTRLQAEIDRLRSHLLSVEENHTQELLKGQLREKSLRDALQTAEEKVSDQWRVSDKLAALGDKYRESLVEKERLQQVVDTQEKSLTKFQHVLHQFTREKERDIAAAQKELALKLSRAEALQAEKDSEIGHLRQKLSEAQLGLEAAARLTQQLDKTTAALSAAREEVRSKEADLNRIRQQMEQLQVGTEGKVDRLLLKNLLTGYFAAPPAKRAEVLRIITTVLDFTAEERSRVGLDEPAGTTGLVAGLASGIRNISSRSRTSSGNSSVGGDADKSLSEAFIRFLETESTRTTPPKLPAQHLIDGSPSASPISSIAPFQPGRNEPTILRDVLRDSET